MPFTETVGFLVCGTQKGGTSALNQYLKQHPEICMSDIKGLFYFSNDSYFAKGMADHSRYHSYFAPKTTHRILGETTPIYMYISSVPERIWQYNPRMRIIVLLRNPVKRAYSQWNMMCDHGTESLDFWDALQSEEKRREGPFPPPLEYGAYSYIDRGRYLVQLQRFYQYFPKESVLALKSEELNKNPQLVLNKITDFLGVSRFARVKPITKHSISYQAPMKTKEREFLISVFEPEIRALAAELHWDLTDWLEF